MIFSAQYRKRYDKSSCCEPFEPKHTMRGTLKPLFGPQRFDGYPRLFIWEFPPGKQHQSAMLIAGSHLLMDTCFSV